MEHWFENEAVIVTGAGGGIGRAAALLFSRRGARVVVTDIRRDSAEVTAGLIASEGGEAIMIDGDIGDPAFASALVEETVRRFGRLGCAFNNAGVFLADDCEWSDAALQRTIHVNLVGTMNCIREEVSAMLQTGGGTIVNTASISGLIASEQVAQPAYTATKHAVIGLTKAAAMQYAKRNIRVNAICPGVTLTDMVRQALDYGPEARKILESGTPLGRLAQPEEMAEAAVWLASSKSSFVTGHSLVVDGGFSVQ